MGNRRSQIISSGINYTNLSTIGFIPKVQSLLPPTVNNSILQQVADGAVDYIRVGPTALIAAGATETFRTAQGIISEANDGAGVAIDRTVVLGEGARVFTIAGQGAGQIAIGFGAVISAGGSPASICIGDGATVGSNVGRAIVLGAAATVVQQGALGGGSADGIAIGGSSIARTTNTTTAIAIGRLADAAREGIAIGRSAFTPQVGADRDGGMAIGHGSNAGLDATATKNTVVGHGSGVSAGNGVSWNTIVGRNMAVANPGGANVIIGAQVDALQRSETGAANIIIGFWTGNGTYAGGSNRCLIGGNGAGTDIRTVIVGGGDTAITPAAKLFRWTDGSGANNPAGAVTFRAPISTGNAASAPFIIEVGQQVAGSSSVLQTPGAAATFSHTTAGGHLATFGGGIATADPGAGVGIWRLGQVQAAAVVLDATQYVEVMIDGAVVRLGIVV